MLTRKQRELLLFIDERLRDGGVSPSFDEMKEALGLKSKSGIHRLISGLEERGFIRRLAHRARALEVLRRPDEGEGARGVASRSSDLAAQSPVEFPPDFPPVEVARLPLYGSIAAGTPIEALRDHSTSVDVPIGMLGSGDHYALSVAGDSMIEAGILDGDTVIIRRCDTAENGSIVVALVEENEVTLKTLRRRPGSIALEPANSRYETRVFGPDKVRVQGRLVGLLRRY